MERDNIVAGAVALQAVAAAGFALADVTHHQHELPASYVEKYGLGINDPYPVGHVLDAQGIVAKDGLAEIQGIMMIQNPTVCNLISAGRVNGYSVVDMIRKKVCNGDTCRFEGLRPRILLQHHFKQNRRLRHKAVTCRLLRSWPVTCRCAMFGCLDKMRLSLCHCEAHK